MTNKDTKTLTFSFDNYQALCEYKLQIQAIVKGTLRIDFDIVLEYLRSLHNEDALKQFAVTLINPKKVHKK